MTCFRGALAAAALALATTIAPAASSAPQATSAAAFQSARAVVNIRGSNHVISFGGSISGLSALQQVASVETVSYGGQGTAVCSINGVGNPPIPGQCLGEQSGTYWSYWRAPPGAGGFSYAGTGAGGTSVTDGSVEGWNFGNGPPPFSSFCAVAGCAPPPPPPPPPAVVPPPTAAPADGGGAPVAVGGTASSGGNESGAKSGKQADKEDRGKGEEPGDDGAATGSADTTATTAGTNSRRPGDDGDGEQAAAIELEQGDDGGSPWGIVAAGVAVAGLGTAGMVIRKRRRATPL